MESPPPPPPLVTLPKMNDLTTKQHNIDEIIGFLDQNLKTKQDLFIESTQFLISSSLTKQCSQIQSYLLNRITKRTVSWISRSFKANSSFHQLTLSLQNLSLLTSPRPYSLLPSFLFFYYYLILCWVESTKADVFRKYKTLCIVYEIYINFCQLNFFLYIGESVIFYC